MTEEEKEIRKKISNLTNELEVYNKKLEEITKKKSKSEYKKYIGKWVYYNIPNQESIYVFVKNVDLDEFDDLIFIGYGIRYLEERKCIEITDSRYEEVFNIVLPENINVIDEKFIDDFLNYFKKNLKKDLGL